MNESARKTVSAEAGTVAVASRFQSASTRLLRSLSLLRRTDTKFIVPGGLAVWILARVVDDYKIVMHGPSPLAAYATDYYDTPDLRCFFDDILGETSRYKVRVRSYQDGKCYAETKATNSSGVTRKHRLLRSRHELEFSMREKELIAATTNLSPDTLTRSIGVDYDRLTLVAPGSNERVTVDMNIVVRAGISRWRFPEVAIIESKRRGQGARTPIVESLAHHGIEPAIISKYCCALALMDSSLAIGGASRMLAQMRQAEHELEHELEGELEGEVEGEVEGVRANEETHHAKEPSSEPLSAMLGN